MVSSLQKNYGCLKWYFWLHTEKKSRSGSHCCNSGPTEHNIYPLCFQILLPSTRQFILGYVRPAVHSVCLFVSCHIFPCSHACSPPLHHLKPFPFLLPTPQHALTALALQEVRTGGVPVGSSSTTPWQTLACSRPRRWRVQQPEMCWDAKGTTSLQPTQTGLSSFLTCRYVLCLEGRRSE